MNLEFLSQLLKNVTEMKGRHTAAFFLSALAVIILRNWEVEPFANMPDWLVLVLYLVAVFSFFLFVVPVIEVGLDLISDGRKRRATKRATSEGQAGVLRHLSTLDASERAALSYCVSHNQKSFQAKITTPWAISLVEKGLAVKAGYGSILEYPHTIRDFVWDELLNRREEFQWQPEMARLISSGY